MEETKQHMMKITPEKFGEIKLKIGMVLITAGYGMLDSYGILKMITRQMEEYLGVDTSSQVSGHIDKDGEIHLTRVKES